MSQTIDLQAARHFEEQIPPLCPLCHQENRIGAHFCRFCGARLAADSQAPSEFTPLQPGMLVENRYQILQQIGEGGLGRVFLATDRNGRKVVIKQIRDPQSAGQTADYDVFVRSFQREANILSSLPHPYLPIARDFVLNQNNLLIVMDYIEGRTLAEIQEEASEPLPERRVARWGMQICEALTYLHKKNPPIIHRNIKPKNLILEAGEPERVRLIGFGLARYYVEGLQADEDCLGTAGYSPPEQYGLAQTDARSDIFGLGATLFCLLTRCEPAEFVQHLESGEIVLKFPPVHTLNPQVSERMSQVIAKALQAQPQDRFQTAEEMRQALAEVLEGEKPLPAEERFYLNQPVEREETRHCEFKEIVGAHPIWAIRKIVDQYVVAFLNGEGGRIFWGIRDHDRTVVGVKVPFRQRDEIRRAILDKLMQIQPAVAPSAYRVTFHPVYDQNKPVRDLFVIEVSVARPLTNLLYFTGSGEVYVKTDAGKKKLSGSEIHDEIMRRLQKTY